MTVSDQMHRQVSLPGSPQRIISLVPSQTELLYDLGLDECVVGITKFCVHPESWFRAKTRVGGTKKVDLEKIRALRPDLILGNKEENSREDIEALEQEFPVWMSDVKDLYEALDMIRRVGAITGTLKQAALLHQRILANFLAHEIPLSIRTAAYLIWQDPYMAAAGNTFIDDMMLQCGLVNVFHEREERYPQITSVELAAARPEVILLSSEPYPFKEKHLTQFKKIVPEAQALLVDGEMFSWYGSRLLHAPAYFGSVIERMAAG
jgi:ABC-type Fe3+-hydroxamate transport system substrate-binding protein